jgi:hypothetical protein
MTILEHKKYTAFREIFYDMLRDLNIYLDQVEELELSDDTTDSAINSLLRDIDEIEKDRLIGSAQRMRIREQLAMMRRASDGDTLH